LRKKGRKELDARGLKKIFGEDEKGSIFATRLTVGGSLKDDVKCSGGAGCTTHDEKNSLTFLCVRFVQEWR
jgi:hypothetical protein